MWLRNNKEVNRKSFSTKITIFQNLLTLKTDGRSFSKGLKFGIKGGIYLKVSSMLEGDVQAFIAYHTFHGFKCNIFAMHQRYVRSKFFQTK